MPRISIGSREPPLPQLRHGEGSWPRKISEETGDFSRSSLSKTSSTPRVETNGSAQRVSDSRGASQDHGASRSGSQPTHRWREPDSNSWSQLQWREPTEAAANYICRTVVRQRARSDDSNPVPAVGAVDESCRLNSKGNFNILSEAWIHAPELISYRISVSPIDEELCPSLVSRQVRR